MSRIKYRCTCDKCNIPITKANDENDVSLNSGKYVYCPDCYATLLRIMEQWEK